MANAQRIFAPPGNAKVLVRKRAIVRHVTMAEPNVLPEFYPMDHPRYIAPLLRAPIARALMFVMSSPIGKAPTMRVRQ